MSPSKFEAFQRLVLFVSVHVQLFYNFLYWRMMMRYTQ